MSLKEYFYNSVNEGVPKLNTVQKFKRSYKGGHDLDKLVGFILANFKDITGEELKTIDQFEDNDHIADIISSYKFGEEAVSVAKKKMGKV